MQNYRFFPQVKVKSSRSLGIEIRGNIPRNNDKEDFRDI